METNWREVEYQALRQEILMLTEAQQSAVRFYLPAAAAIFAVPYLANRTSQPLLWSFCAGGAALMIMAMSYTLVSYVESVFKIGTYIKKVIEPATDGQLRWETFLFQSHVERKTDWPSEHVVITLSAMMANLGASLGAGYIFLTSATAGTPVVVAGFFSLLTLPAAHRMWRSGRRRQTYADQIDHIVRTIDRDQNASGGSS